MRYFEIYAWTDCPYCTNAKELLIEKQHQFMFCCLDQSDILLAHIKTKWDWQTVPLILEKHTTNNEVKLIGGFSDLVKYLEDECE
tara:strand:+ start:773 stop:1027 length:255 start_codon:yes stop_codon:yes gene_type:complete